MVESTMQFDREKTKAVILYACDQCAEDDLGAVKLHKVLYYLDMLRYVHVGASVTGGRYRKRPFGPTNDRLVGLLSEMQNEGAIRIESTPYHGYVKKEYHPLQAPDLDRLSFDELALLDHVIDFVCRQNSAKSISDYSHNAAWEMADFGDEMPYRTAYLLYPNEVSSEAFDWAEKEFANIEAGGAGQMAVIDFATFRSRIRQTRRPL